MPVSPGVNHRRRVGMMVEGATDTLELPERSLADPPLRLPDAPFLGRVAEHDEGMVQLVEPAGLLLDEVRRLIETDDSETWCRYGRRGSDAAHGERRPGRAMKRSRRLAPNIRALPQGTGFSRSVQACRIP
jgi:hypothetical protein